MKYSTVLLLIIYLSLFLSCGVILDDTTKLEGTWKFTGAEFYTYNPNLDSFKTYTGTNSTLLGLESPYNGNFFGVTNSSYFTISFERSENEWSRFSIYDSTTDLFIDNDRCKWKINSWESTLELNISETTPDTNFWKNGFYLKDYWPLTTNTTMELYIKASDVGLDYFPVDVSRDTLKVYSMKGFFTKQ